MNIDFADWTIETQKKFNKEFKQWCKKNKIDLLEQSEYETWWLKNDFLKEGTFNAS